MSPELPPIGLPRRSVLCGLAAAVLVPAALAACTPADNAVPGSTPSPAPSPLPTSTTAPTPTSSSVPPLSGAPIAGIAALADVPVGGGTVVQTPGGPVVLVQPTAGTVAGFSAVCPHQGSTVGAPQDGVIVCPSHGSRFGAADGAVQGGPATVGLAPVPVTVVNGQVALA